MSTDSKARIWAGRGLFALAAVAVAVPAAILGQDVGNRPSKAIEIKEGPVATAACEAQRATAFYKPGDYAQFVVGATVFKAQCN